MDILKNTAGSILSYNGVPLGTTWGAAPSPWPTTGLLDRWIFEDTLTGDEGNTWTLTGPVYDPGPVGGAGKALGRTSNTNGATLVGAGFFEPGDDFSVSYFGYVLNSGAGAKSYWMGYGNNNIFLGSAVPNVYANYTGTQVTNAPSSFGTWGHLAMTYRASDDLLSYYYDGSFVTSDTASTAPASGSSWGLFNPGTAAWNPTATARIAMLYMYNAVLDSDEISQLYNDGAGV